MTTDGFAFLLAPGAGAPSSHPRMQDFARLFAELGPVDLLDYPYMLAGRNHPAAETGLLGSNAILACVMWPSTPAERLRLAITAPHVLPSTAVTVSASAISLMTWLNPTPHRLTVYASAAPLPVAPATLVTGRLARPYPSGTFPRRIALTLPSARRLHRNRQFNSVRIAQIEKKIVEHAFGRRHHGDPTRLSAPLSYAVLRPGLLGAC